MVDRPRLELPPGARCWVVTITGVAAQLHPLRRGPEKRYQARVGVDLRGKTLPRLRRTRTCAAHVGGDESPAARPGRPEAGQPVLPGNQRDSAGRKKAAGRLGKIHAWVAHLRDNTLHNITAEHARGYTSVTIEDLNVAGMLQLCSLARHVSDTAFGAFRAQLEYKGAWYRTQVVVAGRWFPSSKTCSACGTINVNLTLSDRYTAAGTAAWSSTGT